MHQFCVGDDRGNHHHARGDTGQDVAAQPGEPVVGQDGQQWQPEGNTAITRNPQHEEDLVLGINKKGPFLA
jgi:hypothetical protein